MRNFFNFFEGEFMLTYDTIKKLCKKQGVTVTGAEKDLGFARGSLCKVNTNKPSIQKVQKLADYFGVSVDYLMNQNEIASETSVNELNNKDEKDIARSLSDTLGKLESQDGLMFDGEAIDDETRELLKISLENAIRTAKITAKKKFTPRKYRVDK